MERAAASIDARTALGAVRLDVADLGRAQEFYERALGMRTSERSEERALLGAGGAPLLELVSRPDAPPRPPGTTGLFHLAVLLPSRLELARALRRLAEVGWPLSGASDHLVSEALYLSDPEGNGIEVYRDRPRSEWSYDDGQLRMSTLPLDLEGVLGELQIEDGGDGAAPPGTRIGHVHLQVADLRSAEAFYAGTLGFEVTVRGYPGALFVSAGGYHHHIGLNTWAGPGAPPPPPGALGLSWFEVVVPGADQLERVGERLEAAGAAPERRDGALLVADPSGNGVLLRAGPQAS